MEGVEDLFPLRFTAFTAWGVDDLFALKFRVSSTTLYPNSQCSQHSQHSEHSEHRWWGREDDLFALRFTAFTAWG